MTINKVCGSGLKAVMLAAQAIRDGDSEIVIAGGQESMSMAPHVLPGSRDGQRMGDWKMIDSMIIDGLWDVYNQYHMGITAENVAKKYGITREQQDALALASQQKAAAAQEAGRFKDEIVPFSIAQKKGDPIVFAADEFINRKTSAEALAGLRPAFDKAGSVTAGNASGLNDGAAARGGDDAPRRPTQLGLKPLARIASYASAGARPGLSWAWARCRPRSKALRARRLEARRPRPARDQRSLRRAGLRGAQGDGLGHQQGQRQRRRDRHRPPDRCVGLPHPGDAAARDAAPRCEEGHRLAVHRRRHGRGADGRALRPSVEHFTLTRQQHKEIDMAQQRVAYVTGGMGGIGDDDLTTMPEAGFKVVVDLLARQHDHGEVARRAEGAAATTSCAVGLQRGRLRLLRQGRRRRSQAEVGAIDVLVNNAGITRDTHVQEDGQGQLGRGACAPTSTACST